MKLEKKEQKRLPVLVYPANNYIFKVKPLFRDYTCTEAYMGHCQTCMVDLFTKIFNCC